MNKLIQDFFSNKNIVIYGVSQSPQKFGNYIYKELSAKNYNILAVTNSPINGCKTIHSIKDANSLYESVIICTKPKKALSIIDELQNSNIKYVWFQQGSESKENIEYAEKCGLKTISKKCIMMYAEPVKSIHSFHRGLLKLFGKY